jgi:DNA-binding transcriptional ArsR family regulator
MTRTVDVIEDAGRAQVLLHPARLQLLEHLDEPRSAAAIARRIALPRQRVNYHLRALEEKGLVELVEERRKGSCTERVYGRTGRAYTISVAALGRLGTTPEAIQDRFSSAYQVALASKAVADLGALRTAAARVGKKLPSLALEVGVRFRSPADRNAFAEELTQALAHLVEKYHDEQAPDGRAFQFYFGGYPRKSLPEDAAETEEPR